MLRNILTIIIIMVLLLPFGCKKKESAPPAKSGILGLKKEAERLREQSKERAKAAEEPIYDETEGADETPQE